MSRLLDRVFPVWYPALIGLSERNGQAEIRSDLLAHAHGLTLEIGAGNGLSVRHYPNAVSELVLVEPDEGFRRRLLTTLESLTLPFPWRVVDADAEALPFPDGSFSTVTTSLTFCSITHPDRALREVHRVLRPEGSFLFHEHVRGTGLRGWAQDRLSPLQQALAAGCHPNRDFTALLEQSPLEATQVIHGRMPRAFPTITPIVYGIATRPL